MSMIPFVGFAPDLDPVTPGVITSCSQMIPTLKGVAGAPAALDAGNDALAASCRGAAAVTRLDNVRRIFAGTQTNLYELSGTAWSDVTRVTQLATPGIATGTGSATGGTLAAATYYVKIVAVDGSGNTTPAGPESVGVTTTGTTSSIAYTWTAVSGAASYRIYYGTAAGAENGYYTSATNSFTLTATSGTAGVPPTVGDINYTGSTENLWRFAQFGNVSLAANQTERIQFSSSGAFADITQAPKARMIETASGFVLAFAINDAAVGGDRPDAWWCSNIYDYATWTPAVSNQAAFGYLLDTPGEIRAAKRLGQDVVAYKERSMYLGRYVGPPVVWSWTLAASDVGAIAQESVVDTGTTHLFISADDFMVFDGSPPRSMQAPVREWFFKNSDPVYRYRTKGYFDKANGRVWWFYASNSSAGALTDAIVYNIKSNRWGYGQYSIETVMEYIAADTTWDSWPPGPATDYENIADLPFDSQAWDTGTRQLAVFGTDHKIKTLNGPCGTSSIITGDFGDDTAYSTITEVKPRFLTRPASASMTNYAKAYEGDVKTQCDTNSINGNKFDPLASGRFHSLKFDMIGDYEMVGFDPKLVPDGEN